LWTSEVNGDTGFECSNNVDDDGDENIDGNDLGCSNANDIDESNCGDGQCEGGENNVSCTVDCSFPAFLRVFVTNTTTNGFLGTNPTDALNAADNICSNNAAINGHPGTYKVWLSTTLENASNRIIDGEYRNVFDQVIANDMNDLLDGSLNNSVHPGLVPPHGVWTGTRPNGTLIIDNNCNDWTSGAFADPVGRATSTTGAWTQGFVSIDCTSQLRLYCFQVS